MTQWIELAPTALLFGRKLQHVTNMANLPALAFSRQRDTLHVAIDGDAAISVDGWASLRVRSSLFKPVTRRLRLVGLASESESLSFDWNCDDRPDSQSVGITSSRCPGERYIGRQDISMPLKTLTRARVESESAPHDLALMVGCLAYLWNYFEIDRVTS